MPELTDWLASLRNAQDRFAALLGDLSEDQVRAPSYDDDWTIADVASHLGSQAEIFDAFLVAGRTGGATPGGDDFQAIWGRWNALEPAQQVRDSIATSERLTAGVERLSPDGAAQFRVAMFGFDADLATVVGMRLGEMTLHTWDIAVMLDPATILPLDATELLLTTLPAMAGRGGKPVDGAGPVRITTVAPTTRFTLTLDPAIELAPTETDTAKADATGTDPTERDGAELTLPGETLIRLVSGRLDPEHTPAGIDGSNHLDQLRTAFPGF